MSNKKLTILAVVACVMVLWAMVQSRLANRRPTQTDEPAYLIQGLDPASIGAIVLGEEEETVALRRQGNGFVVETKDGYPAKTSEVNSLISKCLEIKFTEFITEDPKNHEDLEVTEDKARTVVKFFKTADPNSAVLAGVVVGKTEELGQGTYVRQLSSDSTVSNRVLSAPDVPWISTGVMSYIEQELISAETDEIESVTVVSPDGQYTLKKEADGDDPVLIDMPTDKKLKTSDARSVLTALTSLRFDDVKKRPADMTFDRQYVCRLKDSTEYTLGIAKQKEEDEEGEKTYIACDANFTDTTPVTKGSDVESEEELKAKEAKLLARDEANSFTAKHKAWVYEIPSYKANNLTKELADLLEDAEPEPESDAVDPNAVVPDLINAPLSIDPNAVAPDSAPSSVDPNAAETE
ncbi:MAG: hypothetical protein AMJ65_03625 [Phycisphaerae bacterium SG8_4]|nr:MAG: hypothetical protein AMJ65_03625 [Phycisphaerae bacterium SG8_4]